MFALIILTPSHSVPISSQLCLSPGYTRTWNELIQQASISKNDTRYGVHEAAKVGVSKQEAAWLSSVTGHVICPGSDNVKGTQGSGSLVGRNDLIITNVHVLRNADGSSRDDWANCYFETQSNPPVRRKLMFFDPATIFGVRASSEARRLDYAIVRLEKPILGVEPIALASNAGSVLPGQNFIVVSTTQFRMKKDRKVLPNEPIIQTCSAHDINPAQERSGVTVYSDCSGTKGASGSITLSREGNNCLVGVGILSRSGLEETDGQDYDITAEKSNFTTHLMFDGPFKADIQRSLGLASGLNP